MNRWRLHWDVEDEIVEETYERDAKKIAFDKVLYREIKMKLTITQLKSSTGRTL